MPLAVDVRTSIHDAANLTLSLNTKDTKNMKVFLGLPKKWLRAFVFFVFKDERVCASAAGRWPR